MAFTKFVNDLGHSFGDTFHKRLFMFGKGSIGEKKSIIDAMVCSLVIKTYNEANKLMEKSSSWELVI